MYGSTRDEVRCYLLHRTLNLHYRAQIICVRFVNCLLPTSGGQRLILHCANSPNTMLNTYQLINKYLLSKWLHYHIVKWKKIRPQNTCTLWSVTYLLYDPWASQFAVSSLCFLILKIRVIITHIPWALICVTHIKQCHFFLLLFLLLLPLSQSLLLYHPDRNIRKYAELVYLTWPNPANFRISLIKCILFISTHNFRWLKCIIILQTLVNRKINKHAYK